MDFLGLSAIVHLSAGHTITPKVFQKQWRCLGLDCFMFAPLLGRYILTGERPMYGLKLDFWIGTASLGAASCRHNWRTQTRHHFTSTKLHLAWLPRMGYSTSRTIRPAMLGL